MEQKTERKKQPGADSVSGLPECQHQFTFRKEYLYQEVNTIFSRKICEKCGKEIVLSRQSKLRVILFAVVLVVLLFIAETMMKQILPDISYAAKGMVLVLLFCIALGAGLYRIMNRATYVTYVRPDSPYREAYENARRENDARTRQRYEAAAQRREERRKQKDEEKRQQKDGKKKNGGRLS